MANNLIKNETNVFYTVRVKNGLFVKVADFYYGKVEVVVVTDNEKDIKNFSDKNSAVKVAAYVGGTIIKHTRTTVVTEIAEEIPVVEEGEK